jgi:predicted kinase
MNKEEMINIIEKQLVIPERKIDNKMLFLFFGIPGSGKSTVANELRKKYPAVYISSDEIALTLKLDGTQYYHWTFEIMNYLIDKYLSKGYSVIADSNSDKYSIRKELYEMAEKNNAQPFCFWVKVGLEDAEKRQRERKRKLDKLREENLFYITKEELVKYLDDIEPPRETERVYTIDGTKDVKSQIDNILLY